MEEIEVDTQYKRLTKIALGEDCDEEEKKW